MSRGFPVVMAILLAACVADPFAQPMQNDGAITTDAIFGTDQVLPPPPEPGECPSGVVCGGEVLGTTWRYGFGCVVGEDDTFRSLCNAAVYEMLFDTQGHMILGLDNLYNVDITETPKSTLFLPAVCFPDTPPTAAECRLIGQNLAERSSCKLDGHGGCTCSFSGDPQRWTASGVYSAAGGHMVFDGEALEYCARTNELILRVPYDPNDPTSNLIVVYRLYLQSVVDPTTPPIFDPTIPF